MLRLQHHNEPVVLDALVVLGRGIKQNGELTDTGRERAEIAPELAQIAFGTTGGIVMFTGGRSWRQSMHDVLPPSEGGTMLQYALATGIEPQANVEYLAEEESESTIANMAFSRPLLQPVFDRSPRPRIGFMSDDLHFVYGRVQLAAKLIMPDVQGYAIRIPRELLPEDVAEERNTTLATRLVMKSVKRGDIPAVMRRQYALERANRFARRIADVKPRQGELAAPVEHDMSYRKVERFSNMSTTALSGYLVGRL